MSQHRTHTLRERERERERESDGHAIAWSPMYGHTGQTLKAVSRDEKTILLKRQASSSVN